MEAEFLVCYDYGMGGLWGVLIAESAEAITAEYPELALVDERPMWMTDESYADLRAAPLWLGDDPPQGLLRAVVADREK